MHLYIDHECQLLALKPSLHSPMQFQPTPSIYSCPSTLQWPTRMSAHNKHTTNWVSPLNMTTATQKPTDNHQHCCWLYCHTNLTSPLSQLPTSTSPMYYLSRSSSLSQLTLDMTQANSAASHHNTICQWNVEPLTSWLSNTTFNANNLNSTICFSNGQHSLFLTQVYWLWSVQPLFLPCWHTTSCQLLMEPVAHSMQQVSNLLTSTTQELNQCSQKLDNLNSASKTVDRAAS